MGTRIAAVTLAALVAIQALNAVAFLLLPAPQITVYGARWTVEKAKEAAEQIFAAEAGLRTEHARGVSNASGLIVSWSERPAGGSRPPVRLFLLDRMKASLERDLSGKLLQVDVQSKDRWAPPPQLLDGRLRSVPPNLLQGLPKGPFDPDEADLPIVGGFEIAIQGLDGSWVSISSPDNPRLALLLHPWVISSLCVAVLVAILSASVARGYLLPLEKLVEAAETLGRTRDVRPVDTAGLNEFAVVAHAFNEMQSRIKRFLDERTQMLAAISHDLRTSLTRLRLDLEELPETETKALLGRNIADMEQMISATLAFAGDEMKSEARQAVDLAALLISLCDGYADRSHPVVYTGPNHVPLTCQATAIRRAFVNLLDNAIKYGGSAEVKLVASDECLIVTISDQGPGIPAAQVEEAFQPFRRLEQSRNSETGGVGLGLTIARDIIRSHGGDIRLQNLAAGGLEVTVDLRK